MPHTYKSQLPPSLTPDSGITSFFESFYTISDTPDAHDAYISCFTPDATLIMASKKGVGSSGTFFPLVSLGYGFGECRTGARSRSVWEPRADFHAGFVEILEIRKGMWKTVKSRLHTPQKIFPFGEGSREVMLHGIVEYELLDGRKAEVCPFPFFF